MTPRPATQALVATVLDSIGDRRASVVDVGTGSGAIAIAISSAAPRARVWATDTSRCAIDLARSNVLRHGLGDRITVEHGDLLEPVPGRVDVVVANLPYVPAAEAAFHANLEGEPPAAVFAEGDGLKPYRRLLSASSQRLADDGVLVIQLHRRVLAASRDELGKLQTELERYASRASFETMRQAA
jgi:HemK-like putative methylase